MEQTPPSLDNQPARFGGSMGAMPPPPPPPPPPFQPLPWGSAMSSQTTGRVRLEGCFLGGFLFVSGFAAALSLLVLAICLLVYAGLSQQPSYDPEDVSLRKTVLQEGQDETCIAVVDVKGVIAQKNPSGVSAGRLVRLLDLLSDDEQIKAIVLDMDSPGGEVTAADEIHGAVIACRKKGIHVLTCMHSMGASGGYYIASATEWIVANRMTLTGSIGVIMSGYNLKGLGDKLGIRPMVFKSGEMKDALNPFRDMTETENRYVQKMVNDTFLEFAHVVATGRSKTFKDAKQVLKAPFADGRILSGKDAQQAGLVDQLGTLEDALDQAAKLSGITNPTVLRVGLREGLMDRLLEVTANHSFKVQVAQVPGFTMEAGKIYLLAPECMAKLP